MRPETQDTYYTWDLRPATQDTERGIWDPYDRWDPRPKTNISCQIWVAKTMIQMSLIKFHINRIWVIIFLIFNRIIKWLQHSLGNICTHLPFVFWRQIKFAKFIGNHLFQSLVFIKVAWKRDFGTAVFLWILRNF